MRLMMSENIARNMYSSQGIINFPTHLHLVGHFRILCHDARKHEYQSLSSHSPASEPHLLSAPFPLFQMLEGFPLLHSLTAPYLPVFLNFSFYEQLLQFSQLLLISDMALNGLYTSKFLYVKLCHCLFSC